jgi:hypothetical protein
MQTEVEAQRSRPPVIRKLFAGVVLIIAAALAIKFVVGLVMAVFWTIVAVVLVIAILWALKTLLW